MRSGDTPRLEAVDFVKAVDAYVANSFLLAQVAESITDGLDVNQEKVAALIRSTDEFSEVISKITGARPLDVGAPLTFRGITYDGTKVLASVETVRKVVRQALLHPQSLAEYEAACVFYYCSRHGMCAEQSTAESAA